MSKAEQHIVVIGGGPAGLRAAEVARRGGARVTLFEGQRSVGRKFLVAGKSGLNLTHSEEFEDFLTRYSGPGLPKDLWREVIAGFDSKDLREWASELGIETFVSGAGKVLPLPVDGRMRSTPLLRRWILRLRDEDVEFKTEHIWKGMGPGRQLQFQCGDETRSYDFDAVVLALGGASWPRTGSDGTWVEVLVKLGVQVAPLVGSNCGWECDWPAALLEAAEGLPLKNLRLYAGDCSSRGELVITRYGLEGAPIYRLGPALRAMDKPEVVIDFKPDQSTQQLLERFGRVQRNFVREARRRLKLDVGTAALLGYLPDRGPWRSTEQIVNEIKQCRIPLKGPRPVAEAISSAGGVTWAELDAGLMLKNLPGVFVVGEMIDWDAPTGGFLLQACFSTATHAARAALAWQLEA
ncbi:MAG: TIGR03862 family flavoprotein [Planctomycetes bacterium]|nr:TIGR03862 family flavoprotein [Planctomycetota bacterium]